MQNELKLNCKHAHVEHIRGRMLRFKLSYETGNRRSRRTIAQGALPLMSVMPLPRHTTPQWPVIREEWPFSVPLYHGCAPAPPACRSPSPWETFPGISLSTQVWGLTCRGCGVFLMVLGSSVLGRSLVV